MDFLGGDAEDVGGEGGGGVREGVGCTEGFEVGVVVLGGGRAVERESGKCQANS